MFRTCREKIFHNLEKVKPWLWHVQVWSPLTAYSCGSCESLCLRLDDVWRSRAPLIFAMFPVPHNRKQNIYTCTLLQLASCSGKQTMLKTYSRPQNLLFQKHSGTCRCCFPNLLSALVMRFAGKVTFRWFSRVDCLCASVLHTRWSGATSLVSAKASCRSCAMFSFAFLPSSHAASSEVELGVLDHFTTAAVCTR